MHIRFPFILSPKLPKLYLRPFTGLPKMDMGSRLRKPDAAPYLSPARLKLERAYEQNRQRVQKRDGVKADGAYALSGAKGKPRLLLMGQRR